MKVSCCSHDWSIGIHIKKHWLRFPFFLENKNLKMNKLSYVLYTNFVLDVDLVKSKIVFKFIWLATVSD